MFTQPAKTQAQIEVEQMKNTIVHAKEALIESLKTNHSALWKSNAGTSPDELLAEWGEQSLALFQASKLTIDYVNAINALFGSEPENFDYLKAPRAYEIVDNKIVLIPLSNPAV